MTAPVPLQFPDTWIVVAAYNEESVIAGVLRGQMAAAEQARTAAEGELDTINTIPAALLRRAFNGEM